MEYSSSRHTDNTKKDVLILSEGPTDGLDDTIIMKEAKYSVNITKSRRKLSVYTAMQVTDNFNASGMKTYQFKAKDFTVDNMKKPRLNGLVYDFSVDENTAATSDIVDIHKYLMEKPDIV